MTVEISQKHQYYLKTINENIEDSYKSFENNYNRFNEFYSFFFKTSLTDTDKEVINNLQHPEAEFNIGEAYISRLLGEFYKIEPDPEVTSLEDQPSAPGMTKVLEGHFRHIWNEFKRDGGSTETMKDMLAGGFSAVGVGTEFENPMEFDVKPVIVKEFLPTMCFWDNKARKIHKGDGRFCGRLYPMYKEQVMQDFDLTEEELSQLRFTREQEGFNWSYTNSNNNKKIIMIAEYFEKYFKKTRIVKLVTGHTMTKKQYEQLIERWNASGTLAVPPKIMYERWSKIPYICRYITMQNKVLSYTETNFTELPIVFFGGNSAYLVSGIDGSYEEMTRPLLYHAKDAQRLKNISGQMLAHEIEMTMQHKIMVPKEGLPSEKEYLDAYTNVQLANTLVYNAFKDNDPNVAVPPPREINRIPPPPEIANTFESSDRTMQAILGASDGALGINENQFSGKAMIVSAMQSNAAAMSCVIGFMECFTQLLNVVLGIMPDIYSNRKNIPIVTPNGKPQVIQINEGSDYSMDFSPHTFKVKVQAGAAFGIQQQQAKQEIATLMQSSPVLNEFLSTDGIDIILDNYEFRGIEQLKERAIQYAQQKKQQAANQPPNPIMMKMQIEQQKLQMQQQQNQVETQMEQQKNMMDAQLEAAKIAVEREKVDNDRMAVLAKIKQSEVESAVSMDKASAERTRAAVDLLLKQMQLSHKTKMDHIDRIMDHDKNSQIQESQGA